VRDPGEKSCWFESWFDSEYYHMLYNKRDHTEAVNFIKRLVEFLHPQPGQRALDLACGRGRHSIALHEQGLDVTGIDLSEQSIREAKKKEKEGLSFFVHDMRQPFMVNYFDYTFNLFTSFGYFETRRENVRVVHAVKSGLKKNGIFIIDFLNADLVRELVKENYSGEMKENGIDFHWAKRIEDDAVVKDISFETGNKKYNYTERVQLLTKNDFEKLLAPCFTIEKVFGDYQLGEFDVQKSPRLIIIAKKK
jgi:SAM-dependent methyltransferase